jgi:hypothetical protein
VVRRRSLDRAGPAARLRGPVRPNDDQTNEKEATATMKPMTTTNVSVDGVMQGLGAPDEGHRGRRASCRLPTLRVHPTARIGDQPQTRKITRFLFVVARVIGRPESCSLGDSGAEPRSVLGQLKGSKRRNRVCAIVHKTAPTVRNPA